MWQNGQLSRSLLDSLNLDYIAKVFAKKGKKSKKTNYGRHPHNLPAGIYGFSGGKKYQVFVLGETSHLVKIVP